MPATLLLYVEFGVEQLPWMIDNHHRVTHPIRNKIKGMRGNGGEVAVVDPDVMDSRVYEEKGLVLKKRSEVRSDEEIVEVVRHRGERLPRRPGMPRQISSMNDIGGAYRQGGGDSRRNGQDDRRMTRYKKDRERDGNDSEGSVPPRNRNREVARSRGGGKSRSDNDQKAAERQVKARADNSSSTSSSDLGSTTGDEKKCKKLNRKKWITAGLAGVATIHAVSNVYSSVEKHDKRLEEVFTGKISPEEAHKKQQQARWQDAASIAIAALGIKGAISEWQEVQEQQHEHRELLESREERHRKRLERQRRQAAGKHNGYYKGRDGHWYFDGDEESIGRQGQGSSRSGRDDSRQSSRDGYPRDRSQKRIEGRKPTALSAVENF